MADVESQVAELQRELAQSKAQVRSVQRMR